MIILGIHAGHNASAGLMVDGRIVGLVQEERFTKRKNQTGFPKQAIDCLVAAHLDHDTSKIDRVGYGSLVDSLYWTALDHYSDFDVHDYVREMHEYWYPHFYGEQGNSEESTWSGDYWRNLYLQGEKRNQDHNFDVSCIETMDAKAAFDYFNDVERRAAVKRHLNWDGEVLFNEHHSCHAHWALWGAPLTEAQRQDALILTADSRGDYSNWSASVLDENGQIECLGSGLENALARLYKFTTLILGMRPNEHEYKVMGLASYSQSRRHIAAVEQVFFEALDFRDGAFVNERPLRDSYFDLKDQLEGHRFDNIAAGLQNWATDVTKSWARHWLRETGKRVLCFSGGLSMNIKSNGELLALDELDWLSVPASGGDESLAAGACFRMASEEPVMAVSHVYLGGTPTVEEDWRIGLADASDAGSFSVRKGVGAAALAKLLAADAIVARCVGPSEFGARALGNRSILANPSNPKNLKLINDAIKQRDFWMPFTPSILEEFADTYLCNPKAVPSAHITIGYQTHEDRRSDIVAALHPGDFSARPQFVQRETNPEYWQLINAFRELTGVPVLLNTSLNLHGEPMNYSVSDAVHTVSNSDLDFLALPGDCLLYKRRAEGFLLEVLAENQDAAVS